MIVVDTCIITHLFNATDLTLKSQKLLDIDPDWHVPTTWREEYANVLAKLSKKSKSSPHEILNLFQMTCDEMEDREHKVSTQEALALAMRYQISVYDAHFVVLAEQLNSHLITEDIEILKKCPRHASSMSDYIASK